jgi:Trk K+ transport system NAD-binding subunit
VMRTFGMSSVEAEAQMLDMRRDPARPAQKTRISEIDVPSGSPAIGKRVRDLSLPENCLLVTIGRGDDLLVPRGDTTLAADDSLLVLADQDGLTQIGQLLGGAEPQPRENGENPSAEPR